MSLRKRGSVWWIDFHSPNGERIRRSTETENKTQAKELHDKLKAEAWRLQKLGERPKRYWEDAVVRYLKETAHKAVLQRYNAYSGSRFTSQGLASKESRAHSDPGAAEDPSPARLSLLRNLLASRGIPLDEFADDDELTEDDEREPGPA